MLRMRASILRGKAEGQGEVWTFGEKACHPERSEGSLSGERSFAALRMTKRDGLSFEM